MNINTNEYIYRGFKIDEVIVDGLSTYYLEGVTQIEYLALEDAINIIDKFDDFLHFIRQFKWKNME